MGRDGKFQPFEIFIWIQQNRRFQPEEVNLAADSHLLGKGSSNPRVQIAYYTYFPLLFLQTTASTLNIEVFQFTLLIKLRNTYMLSDTLLAFWVPLTCFFTPLDCFSHANTHLRDEASEVTLLLNEANEAYSMRMLFFSAIAASSNE